MIGRPLKEYMHKQGHAIGEVALKVENLTLPGVVHRHQLRGPQGRDRRARRPRRRRPHRCRARHLRRRAGGERHRLDRTASAVTINDPADAIALGLAFVPEDRAVAGIFRTLSVEQNITAAVPEQHRAAAASSARALERALAADVGQEAPHPPRLAAPADRRAVGRQPAEGDPRPLAAHRSRASSSSTSRRAASISASRPSSTT